MWRARADRAERERVAGVLRVLASELGGEFIGPRDVLGVTDDGEEYGPVPDYGTALVVCDGLRVEAGVQVMGGPNGKSLRVSVPLPPGRTWTVAWLHVRAALLDLLHHATDVKLDGSGLTVWARPAGKRASPRIGGAPAARRLTLAR